MLRSVRVFTLRRYSLCYNRLSCDPNVEEDPPKRLLVVSSPLDLMLYYNTASLCARDASDVDAALLTMSSQSVYHCSYLSPFTKF